MRSRRRPIQSAAAIPAPTVPRAIRRDVPLTSSIRRALAAGTRNMSGRPGENYWQLQTDFTISARLDPATHTITGSETITVHNNSPQDLGDIYLRLDHNIFRPLVTRGLSTPAETTEGMVVTRIAVDGEAIDLAAAPQGAAAASHGVCRLRPRYHPGASRSQNRSRRSRRGRFEIAWRTKLPGGSGGRGHRMTQRFEDRLFQPTQWFPRPAKTTTCVAGYQRLSRPRRVLQQLRSLRNEDRRAGQLDRQWHRRVASPEQVLTATARERLREGVLASDAVVTIVGADEVGPGKSTAAGDRLVWHWSPTWSTISPGPPPATSCGARREPPSQARARCPSTWSIFGPRQALRRSRPDHAACTRVLLKLWVYAFPQLTLQDGPSSGMEYPMVINSNAGAADHEAAHRGGRCWSATTRRVPSDG